MTAHQVSNAIGWIGYGVWNIGNVVFGVSRETITWMTGEITNILLGISTMIAIAVGIKKLFFDKPKERKFNKKKTRK